MQSFAWQEEIASLVGTRSACAADAPGGARQADGAYHCVHLIVNDIGTALEYGVMIVGKMIVYDLAGVTNVKQTIGNRFTLI